MADQELQNYQQDYQTAEQSPEYTRSAGILDEQAALNEQTYAQNRAETIRSFQDTLDQLNFGLQRAGIQARGQYASRNLYNASGSLSGTGELVGTELTQPISRQILSAQQAHEQNLQRLGTQEAQGRLDIKSKKYDILSGVVDSIRRAKAEEERQKLELAMLPGGELDILKLNQEQEAKGRKLLYQKDLAGAVKKYGKDAIIKIGNRKYLLSSEERLALAKARKDLTSVGLVNGFKDRLLTITEAKKFGVPVGTPLSAIVGQQVPDEGTKSFENFAKDFTTVNQISVNPNVLRQRYADYLNFQQALNTSSDKEGLLKTMPADIRPLLRVSGTTDTFEKIISDAIKSSLGGE